MYVYIYCLCAGLCLYRYVDIYALFVPTASSNLLSNFLHKYNYCTYKLLILCRVGGGNIKALPHPDEDWSGFYTAVKDFSQQEGQVI